MTDREKGSIWVNRLEAKMNGPYIKCEEKSNGRLTKEQISQIHDLALQGHQPSLIALETGIPKSVVQYHAKAALKHKEKALSTTAMAKEQEKLLQL